MLLAIKSKTVIWLCAITTVFLQSSAKAFQAEPATLAVQRFRPSPERGAAIEDSVKWRDESSLVLASSNRIECRGVVSNEVIWRKELTENIKQFDLFSDHLLILDSIGDLHSFSCKTGEHVATLSNQQIDELTGNETMIQKIFVQADTKIVVVATVLDDRRNCFVIDIARLELANSLVLPRHLFCKWSRLSVDREYVLASSMGGSFTKQNLTDDTEKTSFGEERTDVLTSDGTYSGNAFYDEGEERLVYSRVNGWDKGIIIIKTIKAKSHAEIGVDTGFEPIDVCFESGIVAIASSRSIDVFNFQGEKITTSENPLKSKLQSISLSPDGKRILVNNGNQHAALPLNVEGEKTGLGPGARQNKGGKDR